MRAPIPLIPFPRREGTLVGSHRFVRMGTLRDRDKCRYCYIAKQFHPIRDWVLARPMGDRS
jgi:hypothetical protein